MIASIPTRHFVGTNRIQIVIAGLWIACAAFLFREYISIVSLNFALGVMTIPWLVTPGVKKSNKVYLTGSFVFVMLYMLLPVKTLAYFAWMFGVFHWLGLFAGSLR